MASHVVDMSRVVKRKGSKISRKIKVGVITIRPFECILNGALSLFTSGTFLPSAKRFHCPGIILTYKHRRRNVVEVRRRQGGRLIQTHP